MKLAYKDGTLKYVVEGDTLFVLSIFVEERRQAGDCNGINEYVAGKS